MKKLILALFFILFLISLGFTQPQNEQITITTYYPSPYGVYRELRLSPSSQPTCDGNNEGGMYYDSGEHELRVCVCDAAIPPNCGWQTAVGGEGQVTDIEGPMCKRTPGTYDGNLGGLAGANAKCQLGLDDPNDPNDHWWFLQNNVQLGWLTQHDASAWTWGLRDGMDPYVIDGWAKILQRLPWSVVYPDCLGWTSASGYQEGTSLRPNGAPDTMAYWMVRGSGIGEAKPRCHSRYRIWCCNF